MKRACIRCGSDNTLCYADVRLYCAACGMTFHKDSVSVEDETARRAAAAKGATQ